MIRATRTTFWHPAKAFGGALRLFSWSRSWSLFRSRFWSQFWIQLDHTPSHPPSRSLFRIAVPGGAFYHSFTLDHPLSHSAQNRLRIWGLQVQLLSGAPLATQTTDLGTSNPLLSGTPYIDSNSMPHPDDGSGTFYIDSCRAHRDMNKLRTHCFFPIHRFSVAFSILKAKSREDNSTGADL